MYFKLLYPCKRQVEDRYNAPYAGLSDSNTFAIYGTINILYLTL